MASKYKNVKTIVDGIKFDSKKEAQRYADLRLAEINGLISNLERQVKFELVPAQYVEINGKRTFAERKVTYIADFVYYDRETGRTVAEDVKGYRTEAYRIKRKLFRFKYPGIVFKEI